VCWKRSLNGLKLGLVTSIFVSLPIIMANRDKRTQILKSLRSRNTAKLPLQFNMQGRSKLKYINSIRSAYTQRLTSLHQSLIRFKYLKAGRSGNQVLFTDKNCFGAETKAIINGHYQRISWPSWLRCVLSRVGCLNEVAGSSHGMKMHFLSI
jgi:hypothetical protein